MKVKLSNRSLSHNNLRTDFVEGEAIGIPTVGKSFVLIAEPLDYSTEADVRLVTTSLVKSVESTSDGWEFQTLNSKYEVEIV